MKALAWLQFILLGSKFYAPSKAPSSSTKEYNSSWSKYGARLGPVQLLPTLNQAYYCSASPKKGAIKLFFMIQTVSKELRTTPAFTWSMQ
jgi:hypothetical protein